MTQALNIAFLGLGTMGAPMAKRLAQHGHHVTVYNRTFSKAKAWVEQHGGQSATTPRLAAQEQDMVLCCVGNDLDLQQVCLGEEGAFQALKPNAIFVDHTTASASIARHLYHEARRYQAHFIDAPVSGGPIGAEKGLLTIMCGGDVEPFETLKPVLSVLGHAVTHMGPAGSGQLTKMMNQTCIAGALQALAEAIHFGKQAGLDIEKALHALNQGAAQSWQLEHRGPTMLKEQFAPGFAIDWVRKDLGLILDEARRNGAQLPVTALVDQFYADLQSKGAGQQDIASLIQRL